ncbi:aldose 1-epimerase [Lecanosticta acicola]|uniref:Aldose 1-epimerase n=1 Tax=Lecanosticta acicola TaxID=111012 RepID=A0AAI9ECN9_9PEZI|nr:aldose 1-epimerase [Lecanosticta acicola]
MKLLWFCTLVLFSAPQITANNTSTPFPVFSGDAFERYNISAAGITASFMPYGARLTNLWVNDGNGIPRDVIMGYDTGEEYVRDTAGPHSYMGGVVGRYANRIKNGTFELGGETFHIPKNSGNTSTLHGGTVGYDRRNWTIVQHSSNTITFAFYDQAFEGFPGNVINYATYSVSCAVAGKPRWTSRLVSIPLDQTTPIMLSNHIYWNLGAFVNQQAQRVYDNTLYMPYAKRYPQVETSQVPNGTIGTVAGTFLDFTTPRLIGSQIFNGPKNSCGVNCTGYNNAFILDRPRYSSPEDTELVVLRMSSPDTRIQMDVRTTQQNLEIFSCNWFNGSIAAKAGQRQDNGGAESRYELHGCIVVEPQGWIDGINNPQWGQDEYQVYGVDTLPAVNFATYEFGIVGAEAQAQAQERDEL